MADKEIIKIGNAVPSLKKSSLSDEDKELMAKVTESVEAQRDHKEFDEKGLGYYILKIKNEDKNNTL